MCGPKVLSVPKVALLMLFQCVKGTVKYKIIMSDLSKDQRADSNTYVHRYLVSMSQTDQVLFVQGLISSSAIFTSLGIKYLTQSLSSYSFSCLSHSRSLSLSLVFSFSSYFLSLSLTVLPLSSLFQLDSSPLVCLSSVGAVPLPCLCWNHLPLKSPLSFSAFFRLVSESKILSLSSMGFSMHLIPSVSIMLSTPLVLTSLYWSSLLRLVSCD